MKAKLVVMVIVFLLVVGIGLLITAWISQPEIISINPVDGEIDVPVTVQMRFVFSRTMDFETVTDRLTFEPAIDGSFHWEGSVLIFTPETSWPGGEEIRVNLEAGARAESWLAFPMEETSSSFTTSDASLAYLWPSEGPADIYALNPLTGNITQFTNGMDVLEYSASGDGMMIYFSAGNDRSGADLYQIDRIKFSNLPIGLYKPERILDCGAAQCRSPVISPNGQYLAYEHLVPTTEGILGPAIVTVVSLPEMDPIPLGVADHETLQPSWSQSGELIFYDRTNHEYVVINLQTRKSVKFPNQTGQPGGWSPDGEFFLAPEIFYYQSSEYAETGTSHLIRYDISTGISVNLSKGDDVEDVEGEYSPEGGMIAFARKYLHEGNWEFGRQLWIMNADGSNPHSITDEAYYNHYDFAWSRDGKFLAFVRFDEAKISDPPELWMVNADGSNPLQLVKGGFSPLWIP